MVIARTGWLATLVLALVAMSPLVAEAQLRAELVGPLEPELTARLTSQLAELSAWSVVSIESGPPRESELRAHDADAVVWVTGDDAVVSVWIADPRRGRLYIEQLARGDDASARYEAITITIRTALEALGAAGLIGIALPPSEPAPAPPAMSSSDVHSEVARAASPDARREVDVWRLAGTLAGQLGADGLGVPAGLAVALGVRWRDVTFEVAGRVGAPFEVAASDVHWRSSHHRVSVGARLVVASSRELELALGVDAGLALVERTTLATGEGLHATPPSWRALTALGVGLRGAWIVVPGWALFVDLGLDATLPAARFAVDDVVVASPWPVTLRGLVGARFEVEAPR